EQVLARLLGGGDGEALPGVAELPPPEVFFDAERRNIYRAFRTLYAEGTGPPPPARAVLAALGTEGRAVDRVAQLLLEEEVSPGKTGLGESLQQLVDRWLRQRLKDSATELKDAARRGDAARVGEILAERASLTRILRQSEAKPGWPGPAIEP
ncbi:MAG: hypothetical protein ACRD2T_02920, partial [Thermoanaerobaculia bacterium]